MTKKLPPHCPSCAAPLQVSRLRCPQCATEVVGEFDLPAFMRLTEKEQTFILDFVRASGSLKEMARAAGVSYPTLRNRLDELIEKINP